MSANTTYHVWFNLRIIDSRNNPIPKYISFFKFPTSFPKFIFTYLYRADRILPTNLE